MRKNYKLILFCFALVILNNSNARNFSKRKYYRFKKGNSKPVIKPSIIKKRTVHFSAIKDSLVHTMNTVNEVVKPQNNNFIYVPSKKTNKGIPLIKKSNSIQLISDKTDIKKEVVVSKKLIQSQNVSNSKEVKDFFVVALIIIATIAIFALIIWGLIWLANLSLLGLISAIILGVFLVLWPLLIIWDFIFGRGISGIH